MQFPVQPQIPFLQRFPFYTCTQRDQDAFQLIQKRIVNWSGSLTKSFKESLDDLPIQLNKKATQPVLNLINNPIHLVGRSRSMPLNVTTSIKKTAMAADQNISKKYGQGIHVIFDGGGLYQCINTFILKLISPFIDKPNHIFQELLYALSNDFDWQYDPQFADPSKYMPPIDEGIIELLAEELRSSSIKPALIVNELTSTKKFIDENPKKNPYLAKTLKGYKSFNVRQPDLYQLYVRVKLFKRAVEVNDPHSGIFSLLTLESSDISHDIFFPIKVNGPPTPRNGLRIDVTSLIKGSNENIFLENSCSKPLKKSKIKVYQALFDTMLGNITFSVNAVANHLCFGITASWYSQGNRCLGKGWFDKIMPPLLDEQKRMNCSLATLIFKQLLSRVQHHHQGDLEMLIALTFNTSALLFDKGDQYSKEIESLWSLVLNHTKNTRLQPYYLNQRSEKRRADPLLIAIEAVMQSSEITIQDLYYILQVIVAPMQHCQPKKNQVYFCHPTQNEDELWSQIEVTSRRCPDNEKKHFDICTLFFPYKLKEGIIHLQKLAKTNPSALNTFHDIQKHLIDANTLTFGIEKSPLQKYHWDPRRELPDCIEEALLLLDFQDENVWMHGYLLSLSHLSQKNDTVLTQHLLEKHIHMLRASWATEKFKLSINALFNRFLIHSEFTIPKELFQRWEQNEIICDLFSIQKKPFVDMAWKYYCSLETKENYKELVSLYIGLIKTCLSSIKFKNEKECAEHIQESKETLKKLIEYMILPDKFIPKTSLKLLVALYSDTFVGTDAELEAITFEGILTVLQRIKTLATVGLRLQNHLPYISLTIIRNPARILTPCNALRYNKDVIRLEIFQDEKQKDKFKTALEFIKKKALKHHHSDLLLLIGQNPQPCGPIKDAIKNRLSSKQENINSTQNIDAVFLLLEELVQNESCWEERYFIMQSLRQIEHSLPINTYNLTDQLLKKFQDSNSPIPTLQRSGFFFEQLTYESAAISNLLLKYLIPILCNSPSQFSKKDFILCSESLLKNFQNGNSFHSFEKITFDTYLKALYNFELWFELIEIYSSKPNQWSDLRYVSDILIDACWRQLNSNTSKLEVAHIEKIGNIIKNMSLTAMLKPELNEKLTYILKNLYEFYLEEKDIDNAYLYLEKIKPLSSKDYFSYEYFQLIKKFSALGNQQQVCHLLRNFFPSNCFELEWISLISILLSRSQFLACSTVFKKNNILAMITKSIHHEKWLLIYEALKSHAIEISEENIEEKKEGLNQLFNIMHSLLLQLKPKGSHQWISYINLVHKSGNKDEIRKIFDILLQKDFQLPLKREEKISAWRDLLNFISKDKDPIFLDLPIWWSEMWNQLGTAKIEEKVDILRSLVNGVDNAFEHSTKPTILQSIAGILELSEIRKLTQHIHDPGTLSKLSIIISHGNTDFCWIQALHLFIAAATAKIDSTKAYVKLMKIFSEYLKLLHVHTNPKIIGIILVYISAIQESIFTQTSMHFSILTYLQSAIPTYLKTAQNSCLKMSYHRHLVHRSLDVILDCPEVNMKNVTQEQINVLNWCFKFLSSSINLFHFRGIDSNMDQNDLGNCLDKNRVKQISKSNPLVCLGIDLIDYLVLDSAQDHTTTVVKELLYKTGYQDRSDKPYADRFAFLGKEDTYVTRIGYGLKVLRTAVLTTWLANLIFKLSKWI